MYLGKPIIKELNYSQEEIAEVGRIQTSDPFTKRKDNIKSILGCSPCCVCNEIPSKKVIYDLGDLIRNESYCDKCYLSVYEKNKDSSSKDLAEAYGCIRGNPNV